MVFIFTYVYLNIFMIYLKLTCMSTLWALPNHSYVMGNLYRLKIFLSVLPRPLFHFSALVSFLEQPKPKIPFLCLSLLRNQTETLVTQANVELTGVPRNERKENIPKMFQSFWYLTQNEPTCSFLFYRSLYFYVHICSLLLILFCCMRLRTKEKARKEGDEMTRNKK